MTTRIRHVAIVSDQYALLGRFYEAIFGMRGSAETRPERAVTVSDGYVGLNINPRKAGRGAGLDHFGLEVDDAQAVCAEIERRGLNVVRRPGTRPFAGISAHDPAGNVFDISQAGAEHRKSVYTDAPRERAPRSVSHMAIRTLQAEAVARFYAEVFGLELAARAADDPSFHVSDGRVTLVFVPWDIRDYEGGGIARPGPDHLGFRVESIAAVEERVAAVADGNPHLRPLAPGGGTEGRARLALLARCRCGTRQMSDPDGVLIDLAEG